MSDSTNTRGSDAAEPIEVDFSAKSNEPGRAADGPTGSDDGSSAEDSFSGSSSGAKSSGPASDSREEGGSPESGPSSDSTSVETAADYLDRLQRLQAEFDNFRKRTGREKEAWWRQAKIGVIQELLPVLDDANRARTHMETAETPPDAEGLMLILKKFADALSHLGLEEMETKPGTEFDPERHEALMTSPSDEVEEGRVASSLEAGFTFEGEIVRPGKVIVSSGPVTD